MPVMGMAAYRPGNDQNVTVETTYNADSQVLTLTAKNPVTGDQTTRYQYGTTVPSSSITRNDLRMAEIYPDVADPADCVTYGYDGQMFSAAVERDFEFQRCAGTVAGQGPQSGARRTTRPTGLRIVARSAVGGETVVIRFVRRPAVECGVWTMAVVRFAERANFALESFALQGNQQQQASTIFLGA
jgi:hypothetical protein